MKLHRKITLLVPTLNEEHGMRMLMPRVDKSLFCQILVVDGNSTDNTVSIARKAGYDVVIQKRPGIRGAYLDALPFVKGDSILTFSPDGNSIPELLPYCIDIFVRNDCDMVIVSRYLDGAKSKDDDMITGFGNWLFTASINLFHGSKYTDAMVIYRIYKRSIISKLSLLNEDSYAFEEKFLRTNISWEPLMSIRAAKAKLNVLEIPGDEPAREGGVRKLQILKWGAAYYWQILREIFWWRPTK